MLTLALQESLQVASNPAFTTPNQENVLGSHNVMFLGIVLFACLVAGKRVFGVGEDTDKMVQGGAGGGDL